MNILHITDIANENGNGVAVAVKSYLEYEKKFSNVAVYNMSSDIKVKHIKSFLYKEYNSIVSLPEPFNKPDLVIFNEVYKTKYLKLYKECILNNIKYIVIPHGCLVKSAQKNKLIKKVIANFLFFKRFLMNASSIQFLSENEKNKSIYKFDKYFISGNGINVIKTSNKYKTKEFVYIGRYDIKIKGLDLLISCCSKNKSWFKNNNVKIQLYGRATNDTIFSLKNLIKKYDVEDIIYVNDGIYGKSKEQLLSSSYAFIQTSRHEGQPMGILEALSYGVPCIVTYGTNFGEYVNKNNCGIGIDFNENELFNAIVKMYNDLDFRNMCSKNSTIVNNEYNWENIIQKCISEYKNIIIDN